MILLSRSNNCPSTQIYHKESYVVEVYVWTVLGTVAFVARYIVRLRILPWRNLQGDDWMGLAVLLFFLALTAVKLTVYHLGSNSDYTEEALTRLSECQIEWVRFGSKLQVSAWFFYACFLWGLKAMVIFLFNRLSLPPYQRRLLRIFTVMSVLTWIAVVLTISFGCHPFHKNWKILPKPPQRCTGRVQNFYTASILNIITDAAILSIALPLLWNLRVPTSRKISLTLLLCSGIFIICAAILAMLMSVLNADSTLNTNLWATREEIAGILAVNAPMIKPMFHKSFWRKDFNPHRAARPRRAACVQPVIDPRLLMAITRPMTARRLGVLSSIGSDPRRLGVLSSVKSDRLSRLSTRDGSMKSSGTKDTASSGEGIDCKAMTKEIEEREVAWGLRGIDGNMIPHSPFVTRGGPEPLLPEPTHSWSSRGDNLTWSGLPSINEEANGESKGTISKKTSNSSK